MSLLQRRRIRETNLDGYGGFTSYPVKLDIDDVKDVLNVITTLGATPRVEGTSDLAEDAGRWELVHDIATVHPADVRQFQIRGSWFGDWLDDAHTYRQSLSVQFSCRPTGVHVTGSTNVESRSGELRNAIAKIQRRVANAPRNGFSDRAISRLLTGGVIGAAAALWIAWWIIDWQSWPGIVAVGILASVVLGSSSQWRWRTKLIQRLAARRASWLQQKSRLELETERRNGRANLRVGLITGTVGAVVGAGVTALLTWLAGGYS